MKQGMIVTSCYKILTSYYKNKNDECRNDRKETIVKEGKWDDEWMRRKEIDVRNEGRNKWEGEEGMKEDLPLS